MRKNIYLLDRNVVSLIKECNSGNRIEREDKIIMLDFLKKIDNKKNFISPLLSIMEGQTGNIESSEKMINTINVETKEFKKFFLKAKIDSDFLDKMKINMSEIFVNNDKNNNEKYDIFLSECAPLLINVKKGGRENIKNKFIKCAKKYNVPTGHPVVICCISALYGYEPAHKIIKPKMNNYDPYNARNDLLVISRLNTIRASTNRVNLDQQVEKYEFITMDKGLKKFLSEITVKNVESISIGVKSSISYSRNMFPKLSDEEYFNLGNILK